jgi:serine phosphatase RsbU (regulator of sigma subunit)
LLRQLHRVGIVDDDPPTSDGWTRFLRVVNDYYRNVEQDRLLLVRSNELVSAEVDETRKRLDAHHNTTRLAFSTLADALGVFGRVLSRETGDSETTSAGAGSGSPPLDITVEDATRRLSMLLGEMLPEERGATELTGVRTNLTRLAEALKKVLSELHEKARLTREVDSAPLAQSFLVPDTERFSVPNLEVVGTTIPLAASGGDWWHAVATPNDEKVIALIGDATGHGVASSVIAGIAKSAACVSIARGILEPTKILSAMSEAILVTARRQVMMTCGIAVAEPATRKVTLASAGHTFPCHIQSGGLRPIVMTGPPLGDNANVELNAVEVTLEKGDAIVWVTDGVVEAENEWEEPLGEKRLRAFCRRLHGLDAATIRQEILAMLTAFRGSQRQNDDMTVIALSFP